VGHRTALRGMLGKAVTRMGDGGTGPRSCPLAGICGRGVNLLVILPQSIYYYYYLGVDAEHYNKEFNLIISEKLQVNIWDK
jgi:hypothetical protein